MVRVPSFVTGRHPPHSAARESRRGGRSNANARSRAGAREATTKPHSWRPHSAVTYREIPGSSDEQADPFGEVVSVLPELCRSLGEVEDHAAGVPVVAGSLRRRPVGVLQSAQHR
jgi:hypothetical protein